MAIPLRNTMYDKIKEAGSMTDVDLQKALAKGGMVIPDDRFNKMLLDLEILGLVTVSWITKDERRIEARIEEKEADAVEEQNKAAQERDYEASFPGLEK
ncbi:MAG: hypothetical protein EB829_03135 [Nitrosopumilus sp. H8]|nr:MAG: hypothetical protein EB830_06905 [Nitrosopumilus sp. H13]RNJ78968.1 MAG: hypothetical protein EB829_03135 [Nitrosopumilus sp. H8]